jgi:hypothetical protein
MLREFSHGYFEYGWGGGGDGEVCGLHYFSRWILKVLLNLLRVVSSDARVNVKRAVTYSRHAALTFDSFHTVHVVITATCFNLPWLQIDVTPIMILQYNRICRTMGLLLLRSQCLAEINTLYILACSLKMVIHGKCVANGMINRFYL